MKTPKYLSLVIIALIVSSITFGQTISKKNVRYFGDHIVADSSSTLIIPVLYNIALLSSDKMALGGDYYANLIFYNFKTDSSKRLFSNDTYIAVFTRNRYYDNAPKNRNITSKYVFYQVYNIDRNKNGKIDGKDPAILYVSDTSGKNLRPLTTENENVVTLDLFEKQKFALVKIQKDADGNGNFDSDDKDYYFVKLDLKTLTFGNKIVIGN